MIRADLFSSASPATVLTALRTHAGEWRQSHIPPELWRDGVSTIECRQRGPTCTVTVFRRWNGNHVGLVRAQVSVEPARDGSIVRVRIGYVVPGTELLAIGFGILTLIGLFVYGARALLLAGLADLFIAVGMFVGWLASRRLAPGRVAEADYVLDRITKAVESAAHLPSTIPDSSLLPSAGSERFSG